MPAARLSSKGRTFESWIYYLTMVEWMVPRLLLWGTRCAEPLRLSECERSGVVVSLTREVAMGNAGLVANARTSLGEDREAMERGQEMERLIGPESVGEAEGTGLVRRDLIGGFQSIRPVQGRAGREEGNSDQWLCFHSVWKEKKTEVVNCAVQKSLQCITLVRLCCSHFEKWLFCKSAVGSLTHKTLIHFFFFQPAY